MRVKQALAGKREEKSPGGSRHGEPRAGPGDGPCEPRYAVFAFSSVRSPTDTRPGASGAQRCGSAQTRAGKSHTVRSLGDVARSLFGARMPPVQESPTMPTLIQHAGLSVLLIFSAALSAAPAEARTSEHQLRYEQERRACVEGRSNQDRATCLREAGAALAEARRGGLGAGPAPSLAHNRLARCNNLPAADRADCVQRMEAGSASGSAQQGGILREATSPVTKP